MYFIWICANIVYCIEKKFNKSIGKGADLITFWKRIWKSREIKIHCKLFFEKKIK